MPSELDWYNVKEYARGVYLSEEFKQQVEELPDLSVDSDPDIYHDNIEDIKSNEWLFAMTIIPESLRLPASSLDRALEEIDEDVFCFHGGFLRKIEKEKIEINSESTFVIGVQYGEPVTRNRADGGAKAVSDIFTSSLLLDPEVPGRLDTRIHSPRALTHDEYQKAKYGSLELDRIKRSLPLNELAEHIWHISESGIKGNFPLLKKTFEFLNERTVEEKHHKIQTAYSMVNDGIKARTKEQGYLTMYTALNYLIEDIGQQSRSAKSEAQMALKMADNGVMSTQTGIEWIEELKEIHDVRSDILWGAEQIKEEDFKMIKKFFREYVSNYIDYWSNN